MHRGVWIGSVTFLGRAMLWLFRAATTFQVGSDRLG
jgi:hypothetical protein